MIHFLLFATSLTAHPQPAPLDAAQEAAMRCESAIAIAVVKGDEAWTRDNAKGLDAGMPLRIASITKSAVAAAALRLVEQGKLALDAPIAGTMDPRIEATLRDDDYAVDEITLRQLLSHSAGLYSHAEDPRYAPRIFADPAHEWTRLEQVSLMAEYGDAVGAPGERFAYSDTGYVILGDMIERASGMPLHEAVRALLGMDAMGLRESWWDVFEDEKAPRARQYVEGMDASDVHGSADAFGGGGLVMSMRDLAPLFDRVARGAVFDKAETLETMRWEGPHEGAERYRLGLFAVPTEAGGTRWMHSGFWGTVAMHDPASGVTVAGATNEQSDFRCLFSAVSSALDGWND